MLINLSIQNEIHHSSPIFTYSIPMWILYIFFHLLCWSALYVHIMAKWLHTISSTIWLDYGGREGCKIKKRKLIFRETERSSRFSLQTNAGEGDTRKKSLILILLPSYLYSLFSYLIFISPTEKLTLLAGYSYRYNQWGYIFCCRHRRGIKIQHLMEILQMPHFWTRVS